MIEHVFDPLKTKRWEDYYKTKTVLDEECFDNQFDALFFDDFRVPSSEKLDETC